MGAPLRREGAAEEGDGGGEGLVGGFGVEAGAFVASEGMLGGEEAGFVTDTRGFEGAVDDFAGVGRDMRIALAEDHQEFAANFVDAAERAGIGVLAELAVVDAGAVPAGGGANVGLERGAECEMPADAEAHGANFSGSDFGVLREPIESRAAVGVEMGYGSFLSIIQAAGAARVVERDGGAWRLDAAIDLGSNGNKAITGKADAETEHRRGELEDVRVAPDAWELSGHIGSRDKHAHRIAGEGKIDVFGGDDHDGPRRLWRRKAGRVNIFKGKQRVVR